jgi:hypothetical protein
MPAPIRFHQYVNEVFWMEARHTSPPDIRCPQLFVGAPTCGRRVRGGESNEDDKDAAKTRVRDKLQGSGVP